MGLLFLSFIVSVVFLPGIVTAQETAQNEDWQFFVDIYGWLPDIIGTFGQDQLTGAAEAAIKYGTSNVAFVKFSGAMGTTAPQGDKFGHSYFRNAPTVASDVVLILRDDLDPGTPGRPLEPIGPHFWQVPPGYPSVKPAQ